jgi:2-C-methyl-D-erythritol 4-phosphate cytidylyltransferase
VGFNPTDDAMLFERHGASVRIVGGDPTNLKVTTSADLVIAEALASASVRASGRRAADIAPAGDGGGE